jgi:peptidoglycan-N-acetylglucosamine deacetylase
MKRVTLSFDNGPHVHVTSSVLDILRHHDVRAHFFVLGQELQSSEGKALVGRAVAEGHFVGNHSFTHSVPLGQDPRPNAVDAEIVATADLLFELAPAQPRRFRPFGGGGVLGPHLLSPRAVQYLVAQQYTCVLWNVVPGDWTDPSGWPARALAQCEAHQHALVVLHDLPDACLERLPSFLDQARALGFTFVADLPSSCTPILDGHIVGDLRPFVTE